MPFMYFPTLSISICVWIPDIHALGTGLTLSEYYFVFVVLLFVVLLYILKNIYKLEKIIFFYKIFLEFREKLENLE